MNHDSGNIILFLGHFHPLLVHLPIGGLLLLGFLEFLAWATRWKTAAQNSIWIVGFAAGGACVSTACGWMLAHSGGYGSPLLKWHRVLGLAMTVASLVTFWLCQRKKLGAYRVSLATTLVLLAVAGHLGGSITHGRGFLTRFAPNPFRMLLGRALARSARTADPVVQTQQPAFTSLILPILQERCASCHGEEKHKTEPWLDMLEWLHQGGEHGPVIKAGKAEDSLLVQRLMLPLGAAGHMPPEGEPQLTTEEIALLEWWINAGAPPAEKIDELKPDARVQHLMEVVSRQSEESTKE